GFGGYYNFQHFESPGTEWAFEVYFGATGSGYLNAGASQVAGFDFDPDTWIFCDQIIDLTNDWTQLYIDGELLYEWPFSYQASSQTGTLQLGGINFYAGAPTGETATYYFDDINVTVLEPGSGAAIINLTPTVLIENINAGTTTTDMINIENTGEEALDFGVVVTYPDDSKNAIAENKIKHSEVVLTNVPVQSQTAKPGGSPEPSDDVVLNYDGENSSAVGLNNGGPMRVAANFTADLVSDYIGMELSSIEVYINDQPISTTAKVWKYGTVALPGPGEMIYEEAWTPVAMSWQTATLSDPVLVTGGDFWVGYEVDHDPATFPAGTDAGPAHPQGDWISTGPGWHHLSDNPDLNYNWNIRANLTGDPIVQWLSVDPMSGTVEVGENTDVEVSFDASELGAGTYYAELVVNSNDPQNTQIIVPVNLGVIPGIDEISKTAVMIYPNPANSFINVKGDHEIYTVELFNLTGQEVYNSEVNELTHTIATDQLDKGVYLLKATLKDGVVTQRVTIQ
ncbi:MAG: T9SS type A sorting domain-containing protein, partial [Bacteroidales bacterium]|nr:T9SS type A sorting domain-containing protein [Bacteroidales bacterium]